MHSTTTIAETSLELRLQNEEATCALAKDFACALKAHIATIKETGFNLRLTGDLGAGKTTFTRALLRNLGITGRVKSPTFELVSEYTVLGDVAFYHFDFYRFASPEEFEEAGFRDLFGAGRICVSEWSEKAKPFLPQADVEITFKIDGLSRDVRIESFSSLGESFQTTLLGEEA